MGRYSSLALVGAFITTVFFLLSMTTPWWYTQTHGEKHRTNCFIDGTCRKDGRVWKNNGATQTLWDWVLALMILAWFPFLTYLHLLSFRTWRVYSFHGRRTALAISGFSTCLLILIALVLFAVGLPNKLGLHSMYGTGFIFSPRKLPYSWGVHVAWYFAITALVFLVPTIIFSMLMKSKRSKIPISAEGKFSTYGTTRISTEPARVEVH